MLYLLLSGYSESVIHHLSLMPVTKTVDSVADSQTRLKLPDIGSMTFIFNIKVLYMTDCLSWGISICYI